MLITPEIKPVKFSLNKCYRDELLSRKVSWKMPGISEFTFYRTYSRKKDDDTLETWNECCVRVIEGMYSIFKTHAKYNKTPWNERKAQRHAIEAADRLFDFKWTPPGRGLWMMGTEFMWERGAACLNNCGYISTEKMSIDDVEELVKPFTFLMDMSMLGVGVGFDTRGAKNNIPIKGYSNERIVFVVEDTRESWVESIALTIKNGFLGGPQVILDVHKVRAEGLPIKGFGGISSGPQPLIEGAAGITQILQTRAGEVLRSTDIVDIQNIIGKVVVAGNVRRTAEIAFAETDDTDFASMKNWSQNPIEIGACAPIELKEEDPKIYDLYNENLHNPSNGVCATIVRDFQNRPWSWKFGGWRWASNNSMFARVGMNYNAFEQSIGESGEPGFAWLDLMRAYGRMKDGINNKDIKAMGGNPCLEQTLYSKELCCLVENYPHHHSDYWDFQRSLKFSFLYAKAVTLMGTHNDETNAIIIRNRRIGTSMTGIVEAIAKFGRTRFFQEFCDKGYNYITYIDKKYSEWLGVPESIKKTSTKPSGTVSLVAGAFGPGVHHPKMTSGYRLVRLAKNSPLVPILEDANYKVEPSVTDTQRTLVVYFPWLAPEGIRSEDDISIWEQVKLAVDMQYWWADNQVSCTVGFTDDELKNNEISRVLEAFDGQIKGISFLRKSNAQYKQMPFTKAPREEVQQYIDTLLPLNFSTLTKAGENAEANRFCEACAI